MTDLPTRMRQAAETLEEASARYELTEHTFPKGADVRTWNASGLRSFADKWAAKDADLDDMVKRLIIEMGRSVTFFDLPCGGPYTKVNHEGIRRILADYDIKKRS